MKMYSQAFEGTNNKANEVFGLKSIKTIGISQKILIYKSDQAITYKFKI